MGRSKRSTDPEIAIDVEVGLVRLGPVELRDQWVDFYALLSLTADLSDAGGYVPADTLARVGPWRHKSVASVGKEVARHLTALERRGLGHVVAHRGRTKAWKLALPARSVSLRPGRGEVEAWIAGRSSQGSAVTAQDGFLDDLERLVEATGELQRGRAESVLDRVDRPIAYLGEPALAGWSAVLAGRAAYQHDDQDLLVDLYERWLRRTDAIGRTVGARLRALMAYKNRHEETAAALASLRRLAADLERAGDVSALAGVLNTTGILVMRLGDPRAAVALHLRSAALSGIVGDYPSLQAALFNLANSCRRARLREGLPPDDAVFRLVDLCLTICDRFQVGSDSAQAEISAARWAFEMDDIPQARRYLARAEKIVATIESNFDQALFLILRAEIEHADPSGAHNEYRDLQTAERLFLDAGDTRSAAEAQRLFRQFKAGRRRR